jgi:glucose/arabinose dehydrogenase
MRTALRATLAIAALAAFSPVAAQLPQPPDCTGISDVSNFDGSNQSDFDGQLIAVRVASGLVEPTFVTAPPDGPGGPDDRLFIVEQRGTVRILDLTTGTLSPSLFLDIQGIVRDSGNEEGLLSLAFHPDYSAPGATNEGRFFVFFTNNAGNNQVSRYTLPADPNDPVEGTGELVLGYDHPAWSNHNGGQIAFGPDAHLYIGTGDGGGSCDSEGTGQSLTELRGKILRINVDSLPYTTEDNPFDGTTPGLDEIWAYGVRNPWRFSFDRETGALYMGDVGQRVWEEINCQVAESTGGENYGWVFFEGNHCPPPAQSGCSNVLPSVCGTITNTPNILEYGHGRDGGSCSVSGGFVYRGCRMTDLRASYFYADYCSSNIRSFRTNGTCPKVTTEINRTADLAPPAATVSSITAFGEDSRGEIYICDRGGEVFKILPELDIMEVSGPNADSLHQVGVGFAWEDLQASSGHPLTSYKVYRADDDPAGTFECVQQTSDNSWLDGDAESPLADGVFFYLVTALNAQGQETRPGIRSDGTPRVVDTASVCP